MASESERAVDEGAELVFAVCHEIGNLLAAVRLQAHLLDEELGPRELAITSVELDDVSARASSLLAQVRALLSHDPERLSPVAPAAILSALQLALDEKGVWGVALEIEAEPQLPEVKVDPEILHHMLLTQVYEAVEAVRPRGTIRVSACRGASSLLFAIEDEGCDDDTLPGWRELQRRGRPLACAVAAHILGKLGGALSVTHEKGINRVAFELPRCGEATPEQS
jgi:nitrogen-specific signal transduction histidine kinase